MRKLLLLVSVALALSGCDQSSRYMRSGLAMEELRSPNENNAQFSYDHSLAVAMARGNIKPRFERAQNACLHDTKFNCTLISASISMDTGDNSYGPNATLIVALPHGEVADFEKGLLSPIEGQSDDATVESLTTTAENVTQNAADIKRKVAQLTDYRDRLAALAKRPNLSVEDLVKIESELSKAQSDLDDAFSQGNDIANHIARERLSITFDETPSASDAFRPVGRVWDTSVQLFGESTANALQFLIQVIPWLPLIGAAFFLFRWLWRIARRTTPVAVSSKGNSSGV